MSLPEHAKYAIWDAAMHVLVLAMHVLVLDS